MFFGRRKKNCGEGLFSPESKLGWAVVRGDLAEVKRLVIDCGANPNIQNNTGDTPLHIAALRGSPEVAELLLEHGANPNIQDNGGWTPLHFAVGFCYVDVVRVLLDHGADPTMRDNNGKTPLDYGSNCEKIVKELRRRSGGTTVYQ